MCGRLRLRNSVLSEQMHSIENWGGEGKRSFDHNLKADVELAPTLWQLCSTKRTDRNRHVC